MFRRNGVWRFLCVTLAAASLPFSGCGRGSGPVNAVIQVKGSDTIVNAAQSWAEEYKNVNPAVEVEVSGGGSGVGIAALIKGTIDIATASRNMKPEEYELARRNTGKVAKEFIVGYDALAVFVHRENPLREISFDRLAGIFGEGGTITRWSQLGVSIPGAKSDEIIRVSRQSSSGTYEFFRERVLHKRDFRLGSLDMNGSKEVVELVGSTRTAIGYSGMGYATPHLKMLSLAEEEGKPAVEPNVANTLSGAYPIARSLQVYTLGEPQGEVKKFIAWVLSEPGQKVLQTSGYVPVGTKGK